MVNLDSKSQSNFMAKRSTNAVQMDAIMLASSCSEIWFFQVETGCVKRLNQCHWIWLGIYGKIWPWNTKRTRHHVPKYNNHWILRIIYIYRKMWRNLVCSRKWMLFWNLYLVCSRKWMMLATEPVKQGKLNENGVDWKSLLWSRNVPCTVDFLPC